MKRRLKVHISGLVQGIGFRPYIYSLAKQINLKGYVLNDSTGVYIDIEGGDSELKKFLDSIREEPPPQAELFNIRTEEAQPAGYKEFKIVSSENLQRKSVPVSAELATCDDCIAELFDPEDRRYGYPFINCTNCGPRFTIVKDVPYDRINTTMSDFLMCKKCAAEYEDPTDRRFHAQPNACPVCGPALSLLDREGNMMPVDDLIDESVRLFKDGHILSVKGLGGYHLACNASDRKAVIKLRSRKYREYKPFAIMVRDIAAAREICFLNREEEELLISVKRPIVLARKKDGSCIAEEVAPLQRYFGIILPYTPLHYLLLERSGLVLVMTSANLSSEPIVYRDEDAIERLRDISDFHIVHNRKIHIRVDDSVSRIWQGQEMVLRRARGHAPLPLIMKKNFRSHIMACGADLKNVFCLAKDNQVYMSHHIGDMDNVETLVSFEYGLSHFKRIFDIRPSVVAYDLHPGYLSSKYARSLGSLQKVGVQHHFAHIVSCMADNGIDGPVIGIAFDGTGFGTDGNIWGGEFLICDYGQFERMGNIEYFRLPGGDNAVAEPWRIAASILYQIFGDDMMGLDIDFIKLLGSEEWKIIRKMLDNNINVSLTSSMGRLFDAVSALIGIRKEIYYEGQAAVELEMKADRNEPGEYDFTLRDEEVMKLIGIETLIKCIIADIKSGTEAERISARFHNTIARITLDMCVYLRELKGINKVALSGGVFQNMFLLDKIYNLLKDRKFEIYNHRRVPTNDGGIALGQAVIANAIYRA